MAKKQDGAVEKRSRAVVKKGENHDSPALGTENPALKPKAKTKPAPHSKPIWNPGEPGWLPKLFNAEKARQALFGKTAQERGLGLEHAFAWPSTPQGYRTWDEQCNRLWARKQLVPGAESCVLAWIATAEEKERAKVETATDEPAKEATVEPQPLPSIKGREAIIDGVPHTATGNVWAETDGRIMAEAMDELGETRTVNAEWFRLPSDGKPVPGLDAHGVDLEAPEPAKASRPWWLGYSLAAIAIGFAFSISVGIYRFVEFVAPEGQMTEYAFASGIVFGTWMLFSFQQLFRNWKGGEA